MPDPDNDRPKDETARQALGAALAKAAVRTVRAPDTPEPVSLTALTLPYLEFSHAMMRAHLDIRAMTAANRKLTDALREVVRRQHDLAWELAESTFNTVGLSTGGKTPDKPGEVFDRAAVAVRELGEAVIEAQLGALRTLQSEVSATEGRELRDATDALGGADGGR
jgi:hypothetical protein